MTLTELAKLAHVSTSTASKAFSMSDEVNEQTRSLIFETAKKHGCFKKFYRAEYPNCVIAVLCPEFESAYYSNLLSIMKRTLSEVGAEMCVSEGGFSAQPVEELIKYYDKFNTVDGIIVIGGYLDVESKHETPIAVIGNGPESADIIISATGEDFVPNMKSLSEDGVDGKVTIEYKAGDNVVINVYAMPDDNWNIPAATITIGQYVESSDTGDFGLIALAFVALSSVVVKKRKEI